MQAPAQLQATIELLDDIADTSYPADRTMAAYFKQRRYIGSKDKGVISEYFYAVLRNRLSYTYLLEQVGLTANSRRLAAVHLNTLDLDITAYFDGSKHGPAPLSSSDQAALSGVSMSALDSAPLNVQLNVPLWITDKLQTALGDDFKREMRATNQQATTDIRVNTLNSTRKQVLHFLAKANLTPAPTPLSPWGLRFDKRVALFTTNAFKQGWFDIQDEGSQLLAFVTGVKAGDKVVDFCAGAGGKTLAMAAMMQNKGTIYACDVHSKRLEQLNVRAKRAGVHNVRTHVLSTEHDKWVKKHKSIADVVLIDAPCSGTGTWRRSPDSRWNLQPENLQNLVHLQSSIIDSAKRLVKSGGRLLYATCSLLQDENETIIADFLDTNPDFTLDKDYFNGFNLDPTMVQIDSGQMRTYPARTNTDGFFVAVLQKAKAISKD